MRKKAFARPELEVCPFFVKAPEEFIGKWNESFRKRQPIYLELGCGKSPFLASMGTLHPEINFIGIDISSDVLGVARRNIVKAYEEAGRDVDNILLTAYNIERIEKIMNNNDTIDRIYINFCNPWPKAKHNKRRLTYPRFLSMYKKFLKHDGEIWFKTDDDGLFEDSLQYFESEGFNLQRKTYDLHNEKDWPENVLTEHEIMFSEKNINIKAAIFKA